MKRKLLVLVMLVAIFGVCAVSYADNFDSKYVREEAARRNIKLISEQQAMDIAIKRFAPDTAHVKEIELDNEADDYPSPNSENFRPVYSLECIANGQEYDFDIDAVTGEILKFKLDN
ncbi:MAG: PepSY domain-containing protein [Synergistaceae bacterium]|nr:PepSY domain-containing protein [Synergistaceae bacterium]